jgi:hypothetical protein
MAGMVGRLTIVLTGNSIGAGVRDSFGWAQSETLAGDSRVRGLS